MRTSSSRMTAALEGMRELLRLSVRCLTAPLGPAGEDDFAAGEVEEQGEDGEGDQRQEVRRGAVEERVPGVHQVVDPLVEVGQDARHEGDEDAGDGAAGDVAGGHEDA